MIENPTTIAARVSGRTRRMAEAVARKEGRTLSRFIADAVEEVARRELRRAAGREAPEELAEKESEERAGPEGQRGGDGPKPESEGVASGQVAEIVAEFWPEAEDEAAEKESGDGPEPEGEDLPPDAESGEDGADGGS